VGAGRRGSVTRYYYTNPLAAAWMAEVHGVSTVAELHHEDGEVQEFIGFNPLRFHSDPKGMRFVVHPDSLHLLEPHIGDFIKTYRGVWGQVTFVNKKAPPCSQVMYRAEIGGGGYGDPIKDVRVYVRNQIPFMWPEVE